MSKVPDLIPGVIRTFSGQTVNILDPDPATININDIAHALSNQCRFSGHTSHFYSVAEHSVLVAKAVPFSEALAGLLHDASEAYLVDIPTPVKVLLPEYFKLEYRLMEVIAAKFGFAYPLSKNVEHEDKWMLQQEWEKLIEGSDLTTMKPIDAKSRFLESYYNITIFLNPKLFIIKN